MSFERTLVNNYNSLAVNVQNLSFGFKKNIQILNDVSLQIPKGKIYALLVSNGCGKTTILRLVLSRLKFKNGFISVFGQKPGSSKSDIPGPGVGYMPQEIALCSEFTIEESLTYYGIIYHMNSYQIKERLNELRELLGLPDTERAISELSGGQQRLTSIAVTMIHRPKLLILDEPTVGVDSLLRSCIWKYLEKMCQNYGITVIITTHYIEEARTANKVGFMNNGCVLYEGNPQELIDEYNSGSLEEAFLIICKHKSQETNYMKIIRKKSIENDPEYSDHKQRIDFNDTIDIKSDHFIDIHRIKALLLKHYIYMKRTYIFFILYCVLPLLNIFLSSSYIGVKPFNLGLAIYNADIETKLSKQFLGQLEDKYFRKMYYNNTESAVQSVINGQNLYAITIPQNFSQTFEDRIYSKSLTDSQSEESNIKLFADMSNSVLHNFGYSYLIENYQKFLMNISVNNGYNPEMFLIPLKTEELIYGVTEYSFADFFATGILTFVTFIFPMFVSAFIFLLDLKRCLNERVLAAGVKPIEILISHMIFMITQTAIQLLIVLFFTYFFFDITINGHLIDIYLLLLLQGMVAVSLGLSVSIITGDIVLSVMGLVTIFMSLLIYTGVIWPIEGIPHYLKLFSYWTPLTLPLESLRSIMLRGLNMFSSRVLSGFLVSILYNIIVFLINIILINFF